MLKDDDGCPLDLVVLYGIRGMNRRHGEGLPPVKESTLLSLQQRTTMTQIQVHRGLFVEIRRHTAWKSYKAGAVCAQQFQNLKKTTML